jgi:RimJ/RimL family protein N-acetyltransferase
MISIQPDQVTPALQALFDPDAPTAIRCFAVLQGGNAGIIWVDDPRNPRSAYVWEADDGTLYRGGTQDAVGLLDAVTRLRQEGVVALAYREGDVRVALFPPDPNAGATCLEFTRPMSSSDLSPYLGPLPPGYALYRMDRARLESSPQRESAVHRYGSLDNLLDEGLAVCLMHGDDAVCKAFADADVRGVRELGVTTQKPYRGRGFATITCAYLVRLCEEMGSHAYWDCAALNLPSAALARRLGFQNERPYRRLAWFPPSFP